MQVHPIKPELEPPVSKRLKLKCDEPLSNFAFKFNLHRYTKELVEECPAAAAMFAAASEILGRAVQVDPIKPTLKAPGTKRLKL